MMVGMTARAKIAVSLPAELVAAARRAVKSGRAPSVSAYVESALSTQVESDEGGDWIDEMLAETGGPMTAEEEAWAGDVLGLPRARRSTRAR
jgi:Arc/MetJ-type ribon-helix-helix transcriptional regulator